MLVGQDDDVEALGQRRDVGDDLRDTRRAAGCAGVYPAIDQHPERLAALGGRELDQAAVAEAVAVKAGANLAHGASSAWAMANGSAAARAEVSKYWARRTLPGGAAAKARWRSRRVVLSMCLTTE